MSPLTKEWVDKAEGDLATALRERRARKSPNYDSACFHAQQCAEKYLKAVLQENGISIPKTHDLQLLLNLISPLNPFWVTLMPECALLTNYAVNFRYPGSSATLLDAKQGLVALDPIRSFVRQELGI
ncbi:HEPN domain-containing protein [Armatimonas sp.]|uniref:HEPN domain-containing protein n=1 Tax=Armatimonas sp. TaxID=1872638 RepID=UPI00286D6232|nr:HEPN domain-containing protein [Armatimonas sp.]